MYKAASFFLLAILGCSLGQPINEDSTDIDWRVVGGDAAKDGAFPYQVSLRTPANDHFCGGSIISTKTILTAGHCLFGRKAASILVAVGTNRLNENGELCEVERLVKNPDFSIIRITSDVGLIILKKELVFGDKISAIPLETGEVGAEVPAILSGWGMLSFPGTGTVPNDLQFINLITISNEKCKKLLRFINIVVQSQVCTLTKRGEGACKGDSGGPLVADGKQIGIVSWGLPCAHGLPDVFTRVSSFTDWINQNKI